MARPPQPAGARWPGAGAVSLGQGRRPPRPLPELASIRSRRADRGVPATGRGDGLWRVGGGSPGRIHRSAALPRGWHCRAERAPRALATCGGRKFGVGVGRGGAHCQRAHLVQQTQLEAALHSRTNPGWSTWTGELQFRDQKGASPARGTRDEQGLTGTDAH